MRGRAWVALIGAALLAAACASAAPPSSPRPAALPPPGSTADYLQTTSGMVFPGAVGDFRRERMIRVREDGTDEAATYVRDDAAGEEILATVYVYLVPISAYAGAATGLTEEQVCALHFVDTAQAIAVVNPEAELIDQQQLNLHQGDAVYAGRKVVLGVSSGSEGFFGAVDEPLRTELYLFCGMGGDWMVKYRFTHRADHDGGEAIASFMRDLRLTLGPQRVSGATTAAGSSERRPASAG